MNRAKISIAVLFGVPLLLLVLAPRAVLLSFAGVLIAVGLRGLANPLARRVKIPQGLALGLVLLALAQGPELVLPVAGLFLAVHVLEGDFLTPMVQSQAAHLPPALLLAMQLLMGALFGLLGLALAAPVMAMLLVVVRRGYVQSWLRGEETRPEG